MLTPPARDELRATVCVVGAGPAGLTLADQLSADGVAVVLVESGSGSPAPGGADVTTAVNVGLPYSPASTRSSGVGGTSLRWDVDTPLGPRFVRLKELDDDDIDGGVGVGVGGPAWPVGAEALHPHYRRAREVMGIPGTVDEDPAPHADLVHRRFTFGRAEVFTTTVPDRLRSRPHVTLLTGTTVTEVCLDEDGTRVTGVRGRTDACRDVRVHAGVVVLAGGAIENARLLLAGAPAVPAGLGNASDKVGRHFMEHPHYTAAVVDPGGTGRTASLRAQWDMSTSDGWPAQRMFALSPAVRRREGLLNAAYKVKPYTSPASALGLGHDGTLPAGTVESYLALRTTVRRRRPADARPGDVARLVGAGPAVVAATLRRVAARARPGAVHHGLHLKVMGEQEPTALSRVRLSARRDRFGVPLAELDWRLSAADTASMVRGYRRIAPALEQVLGGRLVPVLGEEGVVAPEGGAHHMGTTRMSGSARSGVVDADCQVHGVQGLFVAGSSVFPTGGAANPTLTIVALASRLAGHLAVQLRPVRIRARSEG